MEMLRSRIPVPRETSLPPAIMGVSCSEQGSCVFFPPLPHRECGGFPAGVSLAASFLPVLPQYLARSLGEAGEETPLLFCLLPYRRSREALLSRWVSRCSRAPVSRSVPLFGLPCGPGRLAGPACRVSCRLSCVAVCGVVAFCAASPGVLACPPYRQWWRRGWRLWPVRPCPVPVYRRLRCRG